MSSKPMNISKNISRSLAAVLCIATCFTGCGAKEPTLTAMDRCTTGNPMVGENDNIIYGGDPSVLVDGDTVYLYTGVDASTDKEVATSVYNIPQYVCYSSTDMTNWTAEGVVMDMKDVTWTSNDTSAWASQVMKHDGKYYLYYCSWDKSGKQCIGVAVADSPTGTFVDIGEPLVRSSATKPNTSSYNDIDPTAWIETDEDGVEHRYLAWGNGVFYVTELNEDMISVVDANGDGKLSSGVTPGEDDIMMRLTGLDEYTEAPWLYRRSDENGNYYGPYYLFFAHKWRECMAYATTDDLMSGDWTDTTTIMYPTATSNTNHMAVFDFKGKTYFVYHNGSMPAGSGFRRSACVVELNFNEDGSIDLMEESAAGLDGTKVSLTLTDGTALAHENFINSTSDADYPYKNVALGAFDSTNPKDSQWVIRPGKADTANENYVSIESENKPGLYITVNEDGTVTLAQDTDAKESTAKSQTFVSYEAFDGGEGYTLESLTNPGQYLTLSDGALTLSDGSDTAAVSFLTLSIAE